MNGPITDQANMMPLLLSSTLMLVDVVHSDYRRAVHSVRPLLKPL
jgi:hypothetical protein